MYWQAVSTRGSLREDNSEKATSVYECVHCNRSDLIEVSVDENLASHESTP